VDATVKYVNPYCLIGVSIPCTRWNSSMWCLIGCVSACLLICLHTPSPPITVRLLMCGVIVWMSHILKTVSHSHTHLHPHTQLPTTTTTTAQVFTLLRESTVLTWLPHRYRTLHLKQPTTQKILTNKQTKRIHPQTCTTQISNPIQNNKC
jgi:hypothetical protein